jgi:hypothetical protein
LLGPDLAVLIPYLLDRLPGIVTLQSLSGHDGFQAEFVDRPTAFKGLAGQLLVDLGRYPNKDLAGVSSHANHLHFYDDSILSR